ncbi:MAG: filamentous hemagglutinin N-terminal domain-containing protein, partial [Comamonadaceae bacterium]
MNRRSHPAAFRSPQHGRLRPLALALACMGMGTTSGQTLNPGALPGFPQAGTVVGGAVTGGISGSTMTLNQSTQRAIVEWGAFSLATGKALNITQPGHRSVLLNRVTGIGQPSEIFGSISAPGHVYIVNPAGVLFGAGSQVNVGGLVASTLALSNEALLGPANALADTALGINESFGFSGVSTASVRVEAGATLQAGHSSSGGGTPAIGLVALMGGGEVSNAGTINVAQGTAALGSAGAVTLVIDPNGDGLTQMNFKAATDALAQVVNAATGSIQADGGAVLMGAVGKLGSLVQTAGVVRAQSLSVRGSEISLAAAGEIRIEGKLDASAAAGATTAKGGDVLAVASGQIRVSEGARIEADGAAGGRVALQAVDALTLAPSAMISTNARANAGEG